jgi:hypothetical protein
MLSASNELTAAKDFGASGDVRCIPGFTQIIDAGWIDYLRERPNDLRASREKMNFIK